MTHDDPRTRWMIRRMTKQTSGLPHDDPGMNPGDLILNLFLLILSIYVILFAYHVILFKLKSSGQKTYSTSIKLT